MAYDSDVVAGKQYYILCKNYILCKMTTSLSNSSVSISEVSCKRISGETWKVYEVEAKDYSEQSAKFFLEYHCRLTDSPIDIQPIWPVYIENKYVIKHNQDSVFLHIKGNATNTLVFPKADEQRFEDTDELILKVPCSARQQIVSAGRAKALNYAYFWRDDLDDIGENASVEITDFKGNKIKTEENNVLPEKGRILVSTQYDGFIEIIKDNKIIDRRSIYSKETKEIDQITWGMQISIFIGLDLIKIIKFLKVKNNQNKDETVVLKKLNSFSGRKIKISHTIGSLADRVVEYPKVRQWLYQRIREGYVDEQAYKYLIRTFASEKK